MKLFYLRFYTVVTASVILIGCSYTGDKKLYTTLCTAYSLCDQKLINITLDEMEVRSIGLITNQISTIITADAADLVLTGESPSPTVLLSSITEYLVKHSTIDYEVDRTHSNWIFSRSQSVTYKKFGPWEWDRVIVVVAYVEDLDSTTNLYVSIRVLEKKPLSSEYYEVNSRDLIKKEKMDILQSVKSKNRI